MLSKKMHEAINDQITFEIYSEYIYLSMATYFEDLNLMGFANWMHVQTQEERFHAMKLWRHVVERGNKVDLQEIPAPKTTWDSPLAAFQDALKHEQIVTSRFNNHMALAGEEKDFASSSFLQWFVNEQVEEESSTSDVIQKLKLIEGRPEGLLFLDKELAARVFTPPTTA